MYSRLKMSANILLVDDNPIQAATRRMILEKAGRSVKVAENGARALEHFPADNNDQPFRMIITDHLMPEMNGPEMVRELRNRSVSLPILVLSGLPDAEMAYEGLNVLFRLKPFAPDALLALVQQTLDQPMARTA